MKKLYSFLTGIVLVILVLWGISHQIEASMNTKNSDKSTPAATSASGDKTAAPIQKQ